MSSPRVLAVPKTLAMKRMESPSLVGECRVLRIRYLHLHSFQAGCAPRTNRHRMAPPFPALATSSPHTNPTGTSCHLSFCHCLFPSLISDVSKISCTFVLSFAPPSGFFFLAGLPAGSELMTPAKACRCCAWKVSFGGCGQCGPPFLFMVVAKKV